MSAKPVLVAVAAAVAVAMVIVAIGRGDGGSDAPPTTGLPAVDGTTPPTAYRIVYEVTTPDSSGTEEHVVQRPFDAHIVIRDDGGNVTAERWSTLGRLVTRSQGAEAVRIDTAIASAASDLRPERFDADLAKAKKLVRHDEAEQVGGRACHFANEAGHVTTSDDATASADDTGNVPTLVSRCVDAIGLVLEERWTTAEGERVLTKQAKELEVGDDVPAVHVPDADPLTDAQGNGAVRKVERDAVPPFQEAFDLPDPKGFTFVGRYAVVPPRLSGSAEAIPTDASLALYTDVWRRGPDLVLLDQGAARGGATPFVADTRIGDVQLPGLGTAELAVDIRGAEMRLTRPDGGFVRLSGTIPLDDLVRLGGTLRVLQETR